MTRGEFCARVRKHLKRATDAEWQSIRREILGHVEDRMEDFQRSGLDQGAAEVRAVAAMGEPEEIGDALNRQLSPFWLVLSRVSTACIALLCCGLVLSLPVSFARVFDNLQARLAPGSGFRGPEEGYVRQEVDVRLSIRSDVLRVYWVDLSAEKGLAEVHYCLYDKNPLGDTANNIDNYIQVREPDGTWGRYPGGGQGSGAVWYLNLSRVPVERGQETITLRYDRFGDHLTLEIPLDWGDET